MASIVAPEVSIEYPHEKKKKQMLFGGAGQALQHGLVIGCHIIFPVDRISDGTEKGKKQKDRKKAAKGPGREVDPLYTDM